jgi:hypothetical protein
MSAEISRSRGGQPPVDGVAHVGGRVVDVQLAPEVDATGLDGFDAQTQTPGNLLRYMGVGRS